MKYNVLVFDWDGTLYDSAASIVSCLQQGFKKLELPEPSDKEIRNIIGLRSDVAVKTLAPQLDDKTIDMVIKEYRFRINSLTDTRPALFNGAKKVLTDLKKNNYLLAIATGKARTCFNSDLNFLQLNDFFVTTRCSDESFSKPNPHMLLDIVTELAVDKENVIMVGDSQYDMQFANNAGVDALAVTYGVHDRERLGKSSVKGFIDNIIELPNWLELARLS